jgi:hypothetical protein
VSTDFTPLRAEVNDARGFSRGILNVVVFVGRSEFHHAPAWTAVLAGVSLGILLLFPPRRLPILFLAIERTTFVILAAPVLVQLFSQYRIVFTVRTFVFLCLLSSWSRLARVWQKARSRWTLGLPDDPRLAIIGVAAVSVGFFTSMMLQELREYDANYSGFLHLSERWATTAPFLQIRPDLKQSLLIHDEGYDGQFMYLMAFDPFLQCFRNDIAMYRRVVDDPPYRYGRVGFPLLTRIVARGSPERFPAVMMWLVVLGNIPLAAALASLAWQGGRVPSSALTYLAIPSFAVSTAFALPEGLAAAGIVTGYAFWRSERRWLAVICFGLSLLIRETGLIFLLSLAFTSILDKRRHDLKWLVAAFLPLIFWRVFVASRFFRDFGPHAIVTSPGDLDLPFVGLAQLIRAGWTHSQAAPETLSAIVFPMVLAVAFAMAVWSLIERRGELQVAAAAYACIAISLNYSKIWSHVPSGERGTFETFLMLLLVYLVERSHSRMFNLALGTLFGTLVFYTFFISPEASASRMATLLIR